MADILEALPRCLRNIDKVMKHRGGSNSNSGVLVHCASGISRSVAACAAWLMTRRNYTLDDAMDKVVECRPSAKPNFGFMQALKILEYSRGDLEAAHDRWCRANDSDERDRRVKDM